MKEKEVVEENEEQEGLVNFVTYILTDKHITVSKQRTLQLALHTGRTLWVQGRLGSIKIQDLDRIIV